MPDVETDRIVDHTVGACPECGHDQVATSTWLDRLLARLFGASLNPVCDWRAEVMADYCGCSHPYHSH